MSELAAGAMSLDENQIETPPPAAEAAPPAPATPPPAEDTDPEGTIEGTGGVKFVPLGAVVETRGKLKETKAALEAKEAELAQYREKASKLDAIQQEWNAVQPLIQQVRNGTYQPPAPVQKPAGPLSPQEAVEYAKDLDLYKADGTPDVDRAQRLASRQEAIAQRQTQAAIAPFQQQTAQQQSATLFEQAAGWKDKAGATVDRETLRQVWAMVPPEVSSQPNVASVLYRVAVAESMMQGKYKGAPTPPPPVVPTESLGGGIPGRSELSTVEKNFLSAVDMKPKEYEDISSRFKPGERNSLE